MTGMKLLIENGTYQLRNLGDVAMLQAAVSRLRARLPSAELGVVTQDPKRLARFCPGTTPIEPTGRKPASQPKVPAATTRSWRTRLSGVAREYLRTVVHQGRCVLLRHQGFPRAADAHPYLAALAQCDGLVVTGGGYLSDAWASHVLRLLGWIDLARRSGKSVHLVGHGLGPVTQPRLAAALRRTLPRLDGFTLREGRFAPLWLKRWGVGAGKVQVTGDDAIETAYRARPAEGGRYLGLNIRSSAYSRVDAAMLAVLRRALVPLAVDLQTEFLPFPIACMQNHADLDTLSRLFAPEAVPNLPHVPADDLDPADVIRRIGRCRAVISGSYHGGVFALAQGIPAVCLVRSRYYAQKFLGLASQFGPECQVVRLDEPQASEQLQIAIRRAWQCADDWRAPLLTAAERQITLANAAYDDFFGVVSSRRAA